MAKVNFKDPKIIALGIGALVLVWYFFIRSPSPQRATSAGQSSTNATTSPQVANPNEASPGGGPPATDTGDLLNLLGNVVDNILGTEATFSAYATTTTGQFASLAQSSNQGLIDLATSVVNNPPVNATVYYPAGGNSGGGGGNTSTSAPGGTPAPTPAPAQTFTPNYLRSTVGQPTPNKVVLTPAPTAHERQVQGIRLL